MNALNKTHNLYAADLQAAENNRRSRLYASTLPEEIIENLLAQEPDRPGYEPLTEE